MPRIGTDLDPVFYHSAAPGTGSQTNANPDLDPDLASCDMKILILILLEVNQVMGLETHLGNDVTKAFSKSWRSR